jgi:hypothetical protein
MDLGEYVVATRLRCTKSIGADNDLPRLEHFRGRTVSLILANNISFKKTKSSKHET